MWEDEIVEEIRKHRDAHASRFNYDLRKIFEDLKKKEKKNKNRKVTLKPRAYYKSTGSS